VVLKSPATGKTYAAGVPVPPGSYTVVVDGQNGGSTTTIRAGSNRRLKCVAVMGTCVRN
jgi:hypothetical protein